MENKRGSGIFLGVIGVATLIVAIIGATFAFFTAQISSGEGSVNVTAYDTSNLTVESVVALDPTDEAMASLIGIIPLDATKQNTEGTTMIETAINKASDKCIDEKGKLVCRIYKATIKNESAVDVTLNVQAGTVSNTAAVDSDLATIEGRDPFKDLTFQSLTYNAETYALDGTAVTFPTSAGTVPTTVTVTATANTTTDHYFVIYLNETKTADVADDQSSQMGAAFSGKVVYTTGDNGAQLTGFFEGFE